MTVHTFFRFLCLFVVLALYFSRLNGWYLMCSDVLTVILTSNSDSLKLFCICVEIGQSHRDALRSASCQSGFDILGALDPKFYSKPRLHCT